MARLLVFVLLFFILVDVDVDTGVVWAQTAGPRFIHELTKEMHAMDSLKDPRTQTDVMTHVHEFYSKASTTLKYGGITRLISQAEKYNASEQCLNDTAIFLNGLLNKDLLALKMFDATGKLPGGVLTGNFKWFGDMNECMNISGLINGTAIRGQYNTVLLGSSLFPKVEVMIVQLGVVVGICLPDSCDNTSVQAVLNAGISMLSSSDFIHVDNVWSNHGYPPLSVGAIVAICITAILVVLVLLGTVYDLYHRYRVPGDQYIVNHSTADAGLQERTGLLSGVIRTAEQGYGNRRLTCRFMIAFSAVTNVLKIFDTTQPRGSIPTLHGIRVLSMLWIILGHTFAISAGIIDNLLEATGIIKTFTFQVIGNGTFSVDTFFFLSGLLVGYVTLNHLKQNDGALKWWKFYFHRFWRLTPAYMFIVMIYATLTGYFGNGPMSPILRESDYVTSCNKYWWTNLLYINNFYPQHEMKQCMDWSWYLANDMQFYVITPPLLILLYRYRKAGIIVITLLITATLVASGCLSRYFNLPPVMVAGVTVQRPLHSNQTASDLVWDVMYSKPYTRIAPYLLGLLVGSLLFLTECKKVFNWNKILVFILWLLVAIMNLSVIYGFYGDIRNGTPITSTVSAFYNAFSRLAWSAGVAWVVFATCHGFGGPVTNILSSKLWIPFSRLTYCAYLIHPMWLIVFNVTQLKPIHFTNFNMAVLFLAHSVVSYGLALILALLVESPFLSLEKLFLKRT
ncbi:nose resistant to fluoxetine protein 6-like isoform X2 [Tubulanus polymorphus]|uniref:nose resistant to fluoxetine protein 6-like isoform X2 n=1 Tax=Tubulanus polymorphus TaxID=672921 RepID=UPI003DA60392